VLVFGFGSVVLVVLSLELVEGKSVFTLAERIGARDEGDEKDCDLH